MLWFISIPFVLYNFIIYFVYCVIDTWMLVATHGHFPSCSCRDVQAGWAAGTRAGIPPSPEVEKERKNSWEQERTEKAGDGPGHHTGAHREELRHHRAQAPRQPHH